MLCDVVLMVGTHQVPAHRVVLAGCSSYFCAMFTGPMSESKQVSSFLLLNMGIIDEWYTVFQKFKIPHGLILPVGLMSQTFELSFPAFTLTRC